MDKRKNRWTLSDSYLRLSYGYPYNGNLKKLAIKKF